MSRSNEELIDRFYAAFAGYTFSTGRRVHNDVQRQARAGLDEFLAQKDP